MDSDALIWHENDVRAGLIRQALNKMFFPNDAVRRLFEIHSLAMGLDWREQLQHIAQNSPEKLIHLRAARMIVGMEAEGPLPRTTIDPANDPNAAACIGEA